jgi:hypothetical protein
VITGLRVVLGSALVLAVGFAPAASGSPNTPTTNGATFVDDRGEDPGSPDITTVLVSNDDTGRMSFRVQTPSHQALTEDMRIRVWLSDADPTTGLSEGGADYFILADAYLLGLGKAELYRCDGMVCSPVWPGRPAPSSLGFSYASGAARFSLDADELGLEARLGIATRLEFSVAAYSNVAYDPAAGFDLSHAHFDFAPDRGTYFTYLVRFGPSRLTVRSVALEPSPPRAGRPFVVRLDAARDDTGAAVTTGAVTCTAKIGGRAVRVQSRGFAGGHALCRYALPAGSSGATLRGTITVTSAGKTVTRSFARRIH